MKSDDLTVRKKGKRFRRNAVYTVTHTRDQYRLPYVNRDINDYDCLS